METIKLQLRLVGLWFLSFNFLASLINGNLRLVDYGGLYSQTFNFLASLINGNGIVRSFGLEPVFSKAFNFLASLINGNFSKAQSCIARILLTS